LIFSIGSLDIFLTNSFNLIFPFERGVDFVFLLISAFGATFLLTAFLLGSFFGFGFLTIAFFLITIS